MRKIGGLMMNEEMERVMKGERKIRVMIKGEMERG